MTYPHAAHREPDRRRRRQYILIAAGALVVLVICALAVRFGVGKPGAVDAPGRLSVSAEGTTVKAAWTGVDDADAYQLVRDDGVIVYEGGDNVAGDTTAPQGTHEYTVRAISRGVLSAPSADSEVTVGPSWGPYAPFVKQFPNVLPQSPDIAGWKGLHCTWLLSGFQAETGPRDSGSGDILARSRMACDGTDLALAVAWLDSKQATDAVFAAASAKPRSQALRWRYGTGYFDEASRIAYLRPEHPANTWIAVQQGGSGGKEQLLDLVNEMPLEDR
ncbi:hypothetical protein [Gordonia sp. (in: high G+C Gram-positive bacteria)]|uniref:hypothetical protein n=1 Tax=Gordonia sp. (in: high G+C Gram-positive bacteria) TaxID=84139 RepID=UPI003F994417